MAKQTHHVIVLQCSLRYSDVWRHGLTLQRLTVADRKAVSGDGSISPEAHLNRTSVRDGDERVTEHVTYAAALPQLIAVLNDLQSVSYVYIKAVC